MRSLQPKKPPMDLDNYPRPVRLASNIQLGNCSAICCVSLFSSSESLFCFWASLPGAVYNRDHWVNEFFALNRLGEGGRPQRRSSSCCRACLVWGKLTLKNIEYVAKSRHFLSFMTTSILPISCWPYIFGLGPCGKGADNAQEITTHLKPFQCFVAICCNNTEAYKSIAWERPRLWIKATCASHIMNQYLKYHSRYRDGYTSEVSCAGKVSSPTNQTTQTRPNKPVPR